MTQTLIEKLEALHKSLSSISRTDTKEMADLRAIIEEYKTTEQEPFAWYTEDYLTDKSSITFDKEVALRWRSKGWPVNPLFTHPQPSDETVKADNVPE